MDAAERVKTAAADALAGFVELVRTDPSPTRFCPASTAEEWIAAVAERPELLHEKCDANMLVADALVRTGYTMDELLEDFEPMNDTFEAIRIVADAWEG